MALPTVTDLREYLRVETTVEDNLLDRLLTQARAAVEAYIRQPIVSRSVTMTVVAERFRDSPYAAYATRLVYPFAPVGGSVVVKAADDSTVDSGDYTIIDATGEIREVSGASPFTAGAVYRVTATVGLDLRDDYADVVEPALSSAIIDWAADLYQRRNPAASYESGGGGVAVNYNETASKTMPSRIRVTLDPWKRVLV